LFFFKRRSVVSYPFTSQAQPQFFSYRVRRNSTSRPFCAVSFPARKFLSSRFFFPSPPFSRLGFQHNWWRPLSSFFFHLGKRFFSHLLPPPPLPNLDGHHPPKSSSNPGPPLPYSRTNFFNDMTFPTPESYHPIRFKPLRSFLTSPCYFFSLRCSYSAAPTSSGNS